MVIAELHAVVADELQNGVAVGAWIPSLIDAGVPLLGICYGHQLLARAAGGEVGYHPRGQEIGTVAVGLAAGPEDDPLFRSIPASFRAHATHSQSVLRLPPGAVHLASNEFEPNHAFRVGACAWGVQFHPEYDAAIMRSYIDEQAERLEQRGMDVAALHAQVVETPAALETIRSFARYVDERS